MEENAKLKELCEVKDTLISELHVRVNGDLANLDTREAGEVIDMIKDIAEAEKNCYEAKYYKSVNKAMEEKGEYQERYGYVMPEAKMNGYTIMKPYVDQEPYIRDYLNDSDFESRMRAGYTPTHSLTRNSHGGRYGQAYNDYQMARRHYTDSKSVEDKEMMDLHASEHVNDAMMTIREIYRNADPELKKRFKAELSGLVSEMNG